MNKLNLNAYGVSEMNKKEMQEFDGGTWLSYCIGCAVAAIVNFAESTGKQAYLAENSAFHFNEK